MNTRKDRYAVRISESSYIEMQQQCVCGTGTTDGRCTG